MTIQKTLQKDSVLIGQLELYNRLWKEQDDIWQKAARKSSLPRTSYWILYTIVVTSPAPLSQADLCEKWYFPRQTVNSAVEKTGFRWTGLTFHAKRIWKYQIPPAHTKGRRTCRSLCCPTGTGRHPLFFCFFSGGTQPSPEAHAATTHLIKGVF